MSVYFEEHILDLTLKVSENYNFSVSKNNRDNYFIIIVEFTDTCYDVDKKLLEKIQYELLNIYTNISGFPKNKMTYSIDYLKKKLVFQFNIEIFKKL